MVEAVFKHHTCIICQIAKWNKSATGVGGGVDVNLPGHTVYLDVVTGVNPPSNHGNIGFYFAVCNATGMKFFRAVKSVHEFESFLRTMHAYFAKHGHRMVDLIFDAARFENSEGNRAVYDELGITPKAIAPEKQERNRAERSIQTLLHQVFVCCDDIAIFAWGHLLAVLCREHYILRHVYCQRSQLSAHAD